MSSRRLCVRISNCSRDFLSTWGDRLTVNRSMCVGSGIRPGHAPTGLTDRLDDFLDRLVQQPMIVGFQTNANFLVHRLYVVTALCGP